MVRLAMSRLTIAPYRGVTVRKGGPVASIQRSRIQVLSRTFHLVNVGLRDGLAPRASGRLYGAVAGSGMHPAASVAQRLAISAAFERWAFQGRLSAGGGGRHGYDVDPTSAGLAAMPGRDDAAAREAAWWSALRRYSLAMWWSGLAAARWVETDWADLQAFVIENPLGGMTVVILSGPARGGWAVGAAAAERYGVAFERAAVELARNRLALALGSAVGPGAGDFDRVERNVLFLATPAGYAQVRAQVAVSAGRRMPMPTLACDCEVTGPWSRYATVWRTVFAPPGRRYEARDAEFLF